MEKIGRPPSSLHLPVARPESRPVKPFPPLLSSLPSAARVSQREADPTRVPRPLLALTSETLPGPTSPHHSNIRPDVPFSVDPHTPQPPLFFLHGTSPPHMLCSWLISHVTLSLLLHVALEGRGPPWWNE